MSHKQKLSAFVAGVVFADVVFAFGIDLHYDDLTISMFLGYLFAQVAIIAVWTALSRLNWLLRFAGGLLTSCLVSLVFFGTTRGNDSETVMIALLILSLWPVLVGPLLFMRVRFGWWLAWQDDIRIARSGGLSDNQFRIRQLFGVTGCVAVVLAIARAVVTSNSQVVSGRDDFLLFGILAVFVALVSMTVIWALMCETWFIWLVASGVFSSIITAVELWTLNTIRAGVDYEVIILLNVFQFIALTAGMGSLRLLGIRLRR